MKPNIDRPSTWVRFRQDLCLGCQAGCCMMPVEVRIEDLARLELVTEDEAQGSQKRVFKKLKKAGLVSSFRDGTGLFMLSQKKMSDCIFLDSDTRLCTVYEKRPGVCREFPSIGPRPGYCPCIK
ncbi:MAG: YkgJ family cysteine cluster protein [Bdellovibrionaceae bacterium]|nr:YkgJ family cysteine cluster protein [Pseudobdellovibrionaceae bacterium]